MTVGCLLLLKMVFSNTYTGIENIITVMYDYCNYICSVADKVAIQQRISVSNLRVKSAKSARQCNMRPPVPASHSLFREQSRRQ